MPQVHGPPFTQVLSALRKDDLVRLCGEFRLPTDGSVVILRQRLNHYINLHRNVLYHNQRYTALFPRRRMNPPPPVVLPSTIRTLSHSTSLSERSHTLGNLDDSWHGIGGHPPPVQAHQQFQHIPDISHSPPFPPPHLLPQVHEPEDHPFFQDYPDDNDFLFIHPPHSCSPSPPRQGTPPIPMAGPQTRQCLLTPGRDLFASPLSLPLYETLCSLFTPIIRPIHSDVAIAALCSPPFFIIFRDTMQSLGHYAVRFHDITCCPSFDASIYHSGLYT